MGTIDLPKNPTGTRRKKTNSVVADATAVSDALGHRAAAGVLERETDRVAGFLEEAVAETLATAPSGVKPLGRAEKKEIRQKLRSYIEENYRRLSPGAAAGAGMYTPDGLGELLDSMGGANRFNAGEIEKSAAAKPWEHPESCAPARKADASAFVGRENACQVLACVFGDNARRPKTVTDVSLSLNVPEADLLPPDVRLCAEANFIIGELVCGHLVGCIEKEAGDLAERAAGEGFSRSELARRILERCTETAVPGTRDCPAPVPAEARGPGFDRALGLFVSILADHGLDYQVIEKTGDGYDVSVREYGDAAEADLPDERYSVRLRYFDPERLDRERGAHDGALAKLDADLGHFLDLLEVIYRDSKSVFRVNDFDDLARKNGKRLRGRPADERPGDEKGEPGGRSQIRMQTRLVQIRERMATVCGYLNPAERRISEERLAFLEGECARFEGRIDPRGIRPGLLVEFRIVTVKRKRTTLDSASAALGEFLARLPGVFAAGPDGGSSRGL